MLLSFILIMAHSLFGQCFGDEKALLPDLGMVLHYCDFVEPPTGLDQQNFSCDEV